MAAGCSRRLRFSAENRDAVPSFLPMRSDLIACLFEGIDGKLFLGHFELLKTH